MTSSVPIVAIHVLLAAVAVWLFHSENIEGMVVGIRARSFLPTMLASWWHEPFLQVSGSDSRFPSEIV